MPAKKVAKKVSKKSTAKKTSRLVVPANETGFVGTVTNVGKKVTKGGVDLQKITVSVEKLPWKIHCENEPHGEYVKGDTVRVLVEDMKVPRGRTQQALFAKIVEKMTNGIPGFLTDIPDFYIPVEKLEMIQIWQNAGIHILITGPQGCGKTTFVRKFAELCGAEYYKQNCPAISLPGDWFGSDAANKAGSMFLKSGFLMFLEKAAQNLEVPHIVFLEEWSRIHATIKNPLLALLDDERKANFNCIEGSIEVFLPENVLIFAAANVGFEFVGTHAFDAAEMDRFESIKFSYMPVENEASILVKRLKTKYPDKDIESVLSIDNAKKVSQICLALREKKISGEIGSAPSTRGALSILELVIGRVSFNEAIRRYIDNRYSGEISNVATEAGRAWTSVEGFLIP